MRHPDHTGLPPLPEHVDHAAAQVAAAVLAAVHAGHVPPATVVTAEQHLWRWSFQLRHPATGKLDNFPSLTRGVVPDPTPDVPTRMAVIHLVDVTEKRDPRRLARDLLDTSGPAGAGWQVIHTSVFPDPTRILDYLTDHGQPVPARTPAPARPRGRGAR